MIKAGLKKLKSSLTPIKGEEKQKHLQQEAGERIPFLPSTESSIEMEGVTKSLENINNFSKMRQNDKLPPVAMYEINKTGDTFHAKITLRELLFLINEEAIALDRATAANPYHPPSLLLNHSSSRLSPKNSVQDLDAQFRGPLRYPSVSGFGTNQGKPLQHHSSDLYDMHYGAAKGTTSTSTVCNATTTSANSTESTTATVGTPTADDADVDMVGLLRLRDLRRLDFQFNPNEERSVLIRRHAVLFAMVSFEYNNVDRMFIPLFSSHQFLLFRTLSERW